jgi:hypothetical protein
MEGETGLVIQKTDTHCLKIIIVIDFLIMFDYLFYLKNLKIYHKYHYDLFY